MVHSCRKASYSDFDGNKSVYERGVQYFWKQRIRRESRWIHLLQIMGRNSRENDFYAHIPNTGMICSIILIYIRTY